MKDAAPDRDRDTRPCLTEAVEYASWMDAIRAAEVVQQYKQFSFTQLGLKAGDHVLDVGCGTGDDARALAAQVGATGRVVGIDTSERLISEARERSRGAELPVEFHLQDIHFLNAPDATFHACRADRTFQHLDQPQEALRQMVRVTRAGGIVCLCEPDWSTVVVDSQDLEWTRAILEFACNHVRHGWIGRQLRRLLRQAGLQDVQITPFTLTATDYSQAVKVFGLEYSATEAQKSGIISPEAAASWLSNLDEDSNAGLFFAAATVFVAAGRKPDA